MVLYNTFRAWAHAQDSSAGDRTVAGLLDLLKEGTDAEKATRLRGEGDTISFGLHPEGVLVPVHHLYVNGGTRTQPDVSVWVLVGDGPSAYPVKWSVADAAHFQSVTTAAPWSNVVNLDSARGLTTKEMAVETMETMTDTPFRSSILCGNSHFGSSIDEVGD